MISVKVDRPKDTVINFRYQMLTFPKTQKTSFLSKSKSMYLGYGSRIFQRPFLA